ISLTAIWDHFPALIISCGHGTGRAAVPRLVLPGYGANPRPGPAVPRLGPGSGRRSVADESDETAGPVASRAEALAVVEEIERLLAAGHWAEADGLYVTRCDTGRVFRHLPAAGLGQRAASAFVATTDRRAACPERLSPGDLSFYLNDAGLHAMYAGDLAAAREYLSAALEHDRVAGRTAHLSAGLRNLAECLGRQ